MPRIARSSADTLPLRVTAPPSDTDQTVRLSLPFLPWPLAAGVGGALAALVGWLLLVGVVGVAWATAAEIPLPGVLVLCSQFWLLAHGGPAVIAGTAITLVPLGLTVGAALLGGAAGRFAGGQARLARPGLQPPAARFGLAVAVAAITAGGYAVVAALMVLTTSGPERQWWPVAGAFVIAGVASLVGAARALGLRPDDVVPSWLAGGIRGGLAGGLALLAGGAVLVGLATFLGAAQVAAIEDSLRMDGPGVFVWAATALAYLPTLIVWALSWALGGGFTVGSGSVVSLAGTKLGMLPAVPLFGALPPVGIASESMIAWLGVGVVAGVVAGAVAARRTATGGRGLTSAAAAGLIAGVAASGLLIGAAWAATGSLGSLRLVDLGPRLAELALVAPVILVLAATAAGAACWGVVTVRARGRASLG